MIRQHVKTILPAKFIQLLHKCPGVHVSSAVAYAGESAQHNHCAWVGLVNAFVCGSEEIKICAHVYAVSRLERPLSYPKKSESRQIRLVKNLVVAYLPAVACRKLFGKGIRRVPSPLFVFGPYPVGYVRN